MIDVKRVRTFFLVMLLLLSSFNLFINSSPVSASNPVLVDQGVYYDTYKNPDNTYTMRIGSRPVNYFDGSVYNPIDENIYTLPSGHYAREYGYTLGNEHGPFSVFFKSSSGSSYPVAFAYEQGSSFMVDVLRSKVIGLAYIDPSNGWNYHIIQNVGDVTATIDDNSVTYEDAISGVDLRWIYTSIGLKEEIIFDSSVKTYLQEHPPSSYGLSNVNSYVTVITKLDYTNLDVYNGTTKKIDNFTANDLPIVFKDVWNDVKFALPVGVVYTEGKQFSTDKKMTYRFINYGGNKYLLSGIKASVLNSMEFPVVYDPTVDYGEYDGQNGAVYLKEATWIGTRNAASGMGLTTTQLFTRVHNNGGTGYTIYRGYAFFNTSPIQESATITSVYVNFTIDYVYNPYERGIILGNGSKTYPGVSLDTADYNRTKYNVSLANFSVALGGYNISLSSLTPVNVSGITGLCFQDMTCDYNNSAPPIDGQHDWAITAEENIFLWVTYIPGDATPTNLVASRVDIDTIGLSWSPGIDNTVITRNTSCYPDVPDNGTKIYNSSGNSYTDNGLTAGTRYYYRAWNWNGTNYSTNSTYDVEITYPAAPTNTFIGFRNTTHINITWTKGSGANNTRIQYGTSGYPSSWSSGTNFYNNTGVYSNQTLAVGTNYFKAWSFVVWGNLSCYSVNGSNIVDYGLYINCYDENTTDAITFTVKISNKEGTEVYEATGCTNTHIVNSSLCPQGADIQIIVSATNYYPRIYTMDITAGIIYTLNAYLPNSSYAKLYNIRVVETKITAYTQVDQAVEKCFVYIKRYFNTTGMFTNVTSLYTDANGYVNVYLMPFVHYKVFLEKDNYNDSIGDYIPAPPNVYGQTEEKTFRIVLSPYDVTQDTTYIWFNYIRFNATFDADTGIVRIYYVDTLSATINWSMYLYRINGSTLNLITSWAGTNDSFTLGYVVTDNSSTYVVVLKLNHTYFSEELHTEQINLFGWLAPLTSATRFNLLFTINFGYNPFGWANTVMLCVIVGCFFSFGRRESYIIVIAVGVLLLFFHYYIGISTVWSLLAGGVFPIFLILCGILMVVRDRSVYI